MSIELIPKNVVIGGIAPMLNQDLPGASKLGTRPLTALFNDLAEQYDYRSLQMAPRADGCRILGRTGGEFLIVEPPVVQLAEELEAAISTDAVATKAASVFRLVMSHLQVQVFQLGIRFIYHATAPDNDAAAFTRTRLFGAAASSFDALGPSTSPPWTGAKIIHQTIDARYTIQVEPLLADPRSLYLDIDAQLQGGILDPNTLKTQVEQVERFCTSQVRAFLNAP